MGYKSQKFQSVQERMDWVFYLRVTPRTKGMLDGQRKLLIDYANNNKLSVVGEYVDIAQANRPCLRPQFSEMLKRVGDGKVRKIICLTRSHLAQNIYEKSLIEMYIHSGKLAPIRYVGKPKRQNGQTATRTIFDPPFV